MVQSKGKVPTVSIAYYINSICNLNLCNPLLAGWRSITCHKRVCLPTLTWWKEATFWTFRSQSSKSWSKRMISRSFTKLTILLRNFRPQEPQKCRKLTMEWWWIETSCISRGFNRGGSCCRVGTTICQSRECRRCSENLIIAKLLRGEKKFYSWRMIIHWLIYDN